MKKQILFGILIGAPAGFTISMLITILISLTIGDGNYYPVVPDLITSCGSELNAVLLQTLLSFLYGAAWGGASAIWRLEHWSLLRQTATHLAVVSLCTFPIAYTTQWMPRSLPGILLYFGIFLAIYTGIWFWQYNSIKHRIRQFNRKLNRPH